MDRVNRSYLLAATLIAVPVALLMASLSQGTSPEVRLAVGGAEQSGGEIRQVAGKQTTAPRSTRPGLLQVLAGNRDEGSHDHSHRNMPSEKPKGLLDKLFNDQSEARQGDSDRHNHSANHNHASQHRLHNHNHAAADPPANDRSQPNFRENAIAGSGVNWDGIPYHQVDGQSASTMDEPIRDRNADAVRTRIIRGGSKRSVPARTASVRRNNEPTLAKPLSGPTPAAPIAVPTPPEDLQPVESTRRQLSRQESSRRRDRRELDAMDLAPVPRKAIREVANAESGSKAGSEAELTDQLIPHVTRKEVARKEGSTTEVAPKEAAPKAASQGPTPATNVSSRRPQTAPKPAVSKPNASASSVAETTAPQTPESAEPTTPAEAVAKTDTNATAQPAAKKQNEPQSAGLQATPASMPVKRPYAASTPATDVPSAPVSHRSGPPQSAFAPVPTQSDGFDTAAPIGSGIAAGSSNTTGPAAATQGNVATYRTRTQAQPTPSATVATLPEAPVGQVPTNIPSQVAPSVPATPYPPTPDPYAIPSLVGNRMTTTGQPVNSSNTANTHPFPAAANVAAPIARPTVNPAPGQRPNGGSLAIPNPTKFTVPSTAAPVPNATATNQMRHGGSIPGAMAATSELPGIRVVTNGPGSIMLRQTGQYEIRVENRGAIDARGLLVRTEVPDWAELKSRNATRGNVKSEANGSKDQLLWTIDHLPAGGSEQLFLRLAAARSGSFELDVNWTLVPQTSVTRVQVREPQLNLTIEGPEQVVYGESQTYKVRVLNPGDGTAPNVVFTLSPQSPTPQTQRIGDIPPGKEAQFDVELTAQDLGDLKIHGLASGDLELRSEAEKTIRVAAAKLEATLTGPELKYQNTDAMYGLEVQNAGDAVSEKIEAALRLPAGVTYLGGLETAKVEGDVLTWTIGSLAPGATRDYQFRCAMKSTGKHQFAFRCNGTAAGKADVSIATRVESIADLVLTVSDPPAPAPVGTEVTYEIVIRNRGSKAATDVKTVAQFSHGIEPQRVEGQNGQVVTGQVLFDAIPSIGAGQEVRLRVIAKAENAGHHRFRTEVRSGDTMLVAEEATQYLSSHSERVSRRSSEAATK